MAGCASPTRVALHLSILPWMILVATSSAGQNVFLDIAGTGLATLNLSSANDSFVVIENSGNALTTVKS